MEKENHVLEPFEELPQAISIDSFNLRDETACYWVLKKPQLKSFDYGRLKIVINSFENAQVYMVYGRKPSSATDFYVAEQDSTYFFDIEEEVYVVAVPTERNDNLKLQFLYSYDGKESAGDPWVTTYYKWQPALAITSYVALILLAIFFIFFVIYKVFKRFLPEELEGKVSLKLMLPEWKRLKKWWKERRNNKVE